MPGQTSSPCLHNSIIGVVFVWSALQHLLHPPLVPDPIVHRSQTIPRTSLVERPLEVILNLSPVLLLVNPGEHDEELHFLGIWISAFSRILVFSWRLFQVITSAVVWRRGGCACLGGRKRRNLCRWPSLALWNGLACMHIHHACLDVDAIGERCQLWMSSCSSSQILPHYSRLWWVT